jgi:hypothetical protein
MRLHSRVPRAANVPQANSLFCKSFILSIFLHVLSLAPLAGALAFTVAVSAQEVPRQSGSSIRTATLPDVPQPGLGAPASVSDSASNLSNGAGDLEDSSQAGSNGASSQTPEPKPADDRAPQTKRILGVIPNFRAVSTDEKLPPQTVKDKFMDATKDSFDYSSILIPGMLAVYSMGTDAYPEFHQGAAGYARYFWHAAVDQTSENYMVEFILPTVTHEDTRYYTLGRGGFLKRTGYALSRAVITRSDQGNETFNISEVVGAGASAGISSLYYPSRERSFSNTSTEWGIDVGIDAASFVAREFWPDINRKLFHGSN